MYGVEQLILRVLKNDREFMDQVIMMLIVIEYGLVLTASARSSRAFIHSMSTRIKLCAEGALITGTRVPFFLLRCDLKGTTYFLNDSGVLIG